VWLHELGSQRLAPVTEPHEHVHVLDLAWSEDGTLYTRTERGLSATQSVFGTTTTARPREIGQLPPEMTDIFKQPSKRFHFNVDCCQEREGLYEEQNGSYAVRVTDGPHGSTLFGCEKLQTKNGQT